MSVYDQCHASLRQQMQAVIEEEQTTRQAVSDSAMGARIGVSRSTIRRMREAMGIGGYRERRAAHLFAILRESPHLRDWEIAACMRCGKYALRLMRERLGIPNSHQRRRQATHKWVESQPIEGL
jgi:hypothetical protein